MNLEIGSEPDLTLTRALLIYSSSNERMLIMDHNVQQKKIQAGRPLDLEAFKIELAKCVPENSDTSSSGFIATQRMLFENHSYRVWWTPAEFRKIFVRGKAKRCWLPSLVWFGHKSRRHLCIYSFVGDTEPSVNTLLYVTNMSNTYQDGSLCLGSANPGGYSIREWQSAFYDSSFEYKDKIRTKRYDVQKEDIKIGSLQLLLSRFQARGATTN